MVDYGVVFYAGRCAVSFVPRENGVHQVHVRQNAVPVAGSPFNVLVGKPDGDPAKVGAYGDGLSRGRTRTISRLLYPPSERSETGRYTVLLAFPSVRPSVCAHSYLDAYISKTV